MYNIFIGIEKDLDFISGFIVFISLVCGGFAIGKQGNGTEL
jgi:hypothetical protein